MGIATVRDRRRGGLRGMVCGLTIIHFFDRVAMQQVFDGILERPLAALLLTIAVGVAIGRVRVGGLTLGTSAVLFVALVAGHFGGSVPDDVQYVGIALFVYVVGLRAGPKFFRVFRKEGLKLALLAATTLGVAGAVTWLLQAWFGYSPALATGMFAGAMTSTPALAVGLDFLGDGQVPVGFGVVYPLGLLSVVLCVQLLPRLLGVDLPQAAREASQAYSPPPLCSAWMEVSSPLAVGRTIDEFSDEHLKHATVSLVAKQGEILPARSDTRLERGDLIRVVTPRKELYRLEALVGPQVTAPQMAKPEIESARLVISEEAVAGKRLKELQVRQRYGVTITQIWRDELEFVPSATTTLEIGDTIQVVGAPEDWERFQQLVGHHEERLHATDFLPLTLGLLLGVLLGEVPVPLPGDASLRLGLAGGPLLVGLVAGHWGRIGPLSFRIPVAAQYFARELGLILFLTAAGMAAGGGLLDVLREQGWRLLGAGLLMTLAPLTTAYLLARFVLKLDLPSTLGAICGAMTSTPGLGVATKGAESEIPSIAYAAVYPVALVLITLLTQLLAAGMY